SPTTRARTPRQYRMATFHTEEFSMNRFRSWLRSLSSGRRVPLASRRRAKQRPRSIPRPLVAERLEDRTLLSVQFTAAPYAIPAHQPEVALGTFSGDAPVEPAFSLSPTDPGNVAVSSQKGIRVSTNDGGTFTGNTSFPGGTGGDTSTVYDSAGRLFWVNLTS